MLNLINYITSLQYDFIFGKNKIIIPEKSYNVLCDMLALKDKDGWVDFKPVDGFIHRATGVDAFVFDDEVLFMLNDLCNKFNYYMSKKRRMNYNYCD